MNFPNQENDRLEAIRILSLYHCLEIRQLARYFPHIPESTLPALLKRLEKQGRLSIRDSTVVCLPETAPADGIKETFDVMLDFFPEVSYHAPGSYPVTLTFFAREEGYDVIWLPEGKEILTAQALSLLPQTEGENQRLLVLSNKKQLEDAAKFPRITAFCLVSPDGSIQYFKKGGTYG